MASIDFEMNQGIIQQEKIKIAIEITTQKEK